jgi:hypothetical protein
MVDEPEVHTRKNNEDRTNFNELPSESFRKNRALRFLVDGPNKRTAD